MSSLEPLTYLATLLLALSGMAMVDRRWRLVLWSDPRRAVVVLAAGVVLFLVWDLVAVHQGFYRKGGTSLMTGVEVADEVPVEEVFFVLFLCYVTLVLHRLLARFVFGPAGRFGHAGENEEVSR
jgi:lycopene cyclase domain-containing protein